MIRNSVIVSIAKEGLFEEKFIQNLNQELGPNDELIIAKPADEFALNNTDFPNIKYIKNTNTFAPSGINLCIKEAKGNYISLTGARSFISTHYFEKGIKILANNQKIGAVGGQIIHTANTSTGKAIAKAMGAPLGMGIFSFRSLQDSGYTDTVSVPVFRRELIEKVGLFDENLIRNQDDDYSYRIKKAGYKIWHEATITSTYYVRENYSQLSKQFFQYGFWKNYVNKKHKTITTLRQLAPPIFILGLLILLIVSPFFLAITFLIYLTVLFTESIAICKFNIVEAIKTTIAFGVMHVSYGLGYWYGLFYAFILNKPAPDLVKKITR